MSEESTQNEPFDFPFWVLDESDEPGAIGRVGSFHLQSMIGRGGMGGVFKAWDEELRRVVAVKFIRQDLINDEYRTRFIREARAAAAVTHPNIVAVHRIEECKGAPFIVMEYVEGRSLQQLIDSNTSFQPVQLLQMILQLTEGLQAAHDRGVVHRDIKPSNVLIEDGSDRVKITDFGLARFTSRDQTLESLVEDGPLGTPAFMSPEQVNGEQVDARSDLFSLGCLIYAVVDRHSPFQGSHFAETATRILNTSPPPLSASHPRIPVVISRIVSRLLEKDPDERCQSADEVAFSIRTVLQEMNRGVELAVTETIALDYPSHRRRQRRTLVGVVTVTMLSLMALGWFYYSGSSTEHPVIDQSAQTAGNVPDDQQAEIITVARNGEGRLQTLNAALTAARPGSIIRVLDDAIYEVNLRLSRDTRLNHVVIEAVNGAHLVPGTAGQHVVQIDGLKGVVVRGFRITTYGDEHAILIRSSEGIRLENLNITQKQAQATAAIHILDCNITDNPEQFAVRDCRIETQSSGQCLWIHSEPYLVRNMVVERNRFFGNRSGTLAAAVMPDGSIRFCDNVFDGGHVGLNFSLQPIDSEVTPLTAFEVVNNTFVKCRSWIGLMHTDPSRTPFVLVNNLAIDVEEIEANEEQIRSLVASGISSGNCWERDPETIPDDSPLRDMASLVPLAEAGIRSRDESGYLSLPLESPLWKCGAGAPYSDRVGASVTNPSDRQVR